MDLRRPVSATARRSASGKWAKLEQQALGKIPAGAEACGGRVSLGGVRAGAGLQFGHLRNASRRRESRNPSLKRLSSFMLKSFQILESFWLIDWVL